MPLHADDLSGACDYCLRARQTRKGYWYCTSNQEDYFPDAPWDGDDEYEPTSCPSFKPDPDCYDDDDWIW